MPSPYENIAATDWESVTKQLVKEHPLDTKEIVEVVRGSWSSIFNSKIGVHGFNIGTDIFPKPQIMGFLLHELIPLELSARYPTAWRSEEKASDKDIVCILDDKYSIELKTSSSASKIYGNRSFAQKSTKGKKAKSGYYLTVNFQKFTGKKEPKINIIRFGWLDEDDWIGQAASTGQQSNLPAEVYAGKLLTLYKL